MQTPAPPAPEAHALSHPGSAVGAGTLPEVPSVTPPAVVVVHQYHPAGGSAPATFATPPYHHYHLHQQHVHSHPYHHHHYHVHDPYLQHHALPPFAAPPTAFPFAPGYHHHTQAYQAAYHHQGHWPPYPVSVTAQTHLAQEQQGPQPIAQTQPDATRADRDRPVPPTPPAATPPQQQQQQPPQRVATHIRVLPDTTQLRAPPPGRSDRQLIVNYLDDDVTVDELVRIFSTVGSVESARVMRDATTNAPQGYGFVYMATAEDASRAVVQLDRYKLRKKRLKVAYATPRRDAERNGRCEPQVVQDGSDRSPPPGVATNSNSVASSVGASANVSSRGLTGTTASTSQRNPSSTDADGTDGSSGSSRDDGGRASFHNDRE